MSTYVHNSPYWEIDSIVTIFRQLRAWIHDEQRTWYVTKSWKRGEGQYITPDQLTWSNCRIDSSIKIDPLVNYPMTILPVTTVLTIEIVTFGATTVRRKSWHPYFKTRVEHRHPCSSPNKLSTYSKHNILEQCRLSSVVRSRTDICKLCRLSSVVRWRTDSLSSPTSPAPRRAVVRQIIRCVYHDKSVVVNRWRELRSPLAWFSLWCLFLSQTLKLSWSYRLRPCR